MRHYDWDDLRCFIEVATQGSTLGAARALKLHQTTVARKVDALEQALGVRLFDRSAAGYALSSAGADLLPLARNVAEATAAFGERARLNARRKGQIVRVTTSDVLANLIITPALPEFAASHPHVQIHTVIDDRKLDLARGEADIAVRVGTRPQEGDLIVRRLAEAAWGLYCSADYAARHGAPSRPDDLARHPVLGFDGILGEAPAGQWIREHAATALPAGQSNNLVNHLQAVKAGIGVGALPRIEGDRHPDLRLCLPKMEGASQAIWLVMRKDARADEAVSALADLIIARVSAMKGAFAGVEC
jgi:DNA-binding transcriptional LysR family regulator